MWNWRKVVEVFKRRMSIEELFRDEENIRYGWGLRQTKVGTAGRLERLLLVLAYAYLLLLLIGLVCRGTMSETHWASAASKSRNQARGFTIGGHMHTRLKWRLKTLLAAYARMLTEWVGGELGMTQSVGALRPSPKRSMIAFTADRMAGCSSQPGSAE